MKNIFWCLIVVGVFLNAAVFAQPELDTTFNSSGKKVLQIGAIGSTSDMVIQPDNKIVLVSGCFSVNVSLVPLCIVRLNEDGSFDSTFGGGPSTPAGVSFTTIQGAQSGIASGVALMDDGRLVVAGWLSLTSGNNNENIIIARYNANGSLDKSFGSGGKVITDVAPGQNDRAKKVAVQPDGKIVVAGYQGTSTGGFQQFIARYNLDGTLDNSFGKGGFVKPTISGQSTLGISIALLPDGKILIGGNLLNFTSPSSGSYLLTRLNPDGSTDTSWDGDGFNSIAYGVPNYPDAGIRSLAIRPDGRVVALGHDNIIFSFNANGSPDLSFDFDGTRQALNGSYDPYDLMLSAGGRITVVGHPPAGFNSNGVPMLYQAARYMPDGSPDTTFSDDGYLSIDVGDSLNDGAKAVAVDSRGRTVIGGVTALGTVHFPFESPQFSVARLIAPPAFPVGISGRATRWDGSPVNKAVVTLRNNSGVIATSRTNPFGYFSFSNVMTGQNYTISVKLKGLNFTDSSIFVVDDIPNLEFVAGQL
ncbi:MAG: carboxypeptidase regulatory-like domain-containing protein [Pyrinomonadaceae bacterium]